MDIMIQIKAAPSLRDVDIVVENENKTDIMNPAIIDELNALFTTIHTYRGDTEELNLRGCRKALFSLMTTVGNIKDFEIYNVTLAAYIKYVVEGVNDQRLVFDLISAMVSDDAQRINIESILGMNRED